MPIYRKLKDTPKGYPIDGKTLSILRAVIAAEKFNYCDNPSFELGLTNWSIGVGGTITLASDKSMFGVYSLKSTAGGGGGAGALYTSFAATAGVTYFVSMYGYWASGITYNLSVVPTGSLTAVSPTTVFVGKNKWERKIVFYRETSTLSRRVYISQIGTSVSFWIDGVQIERDTLTSYFDGSFKGYLRDENAYAWVGAEHASQSYRSGTTLSGGQVVNLRKFGLTVLAVAGAGLATPQNFSAPVLNLGGSIYQGSVAPPDRVTGFPAKVQAQDPLELKRNRSDLVELFEPSRQTPLGLRVQWLDQNDDDIGYELEVPSVYEGGLDGNWDNLAEDSIPLAFKTYLPFVAREVGSRGAELKYVELTQALYTYASATAGYTIVVRDPSTGEWSAIGQTTIPGIDYIRFLIVGSRLYAVGSFSSITNTAGGTVAAANIAYYDFLTGTWNAIGTGLNNAAYGATLAPDGKIWVYGSFTSANGVALTAYLAALDPTTNTFSTLTPAGAINAAVRAVAFGPTGIAYIGGDLTSVNAVGVTRVATRSVAGVWTAMSTLNNTVQALAVRNNVVYAGGSFTDYFAYWTGAAWAIVGGTGSTNNEVRAMYNSDDGNLYVGGTYTQIAGIAANRISGYNGVKAFPLGSGVGSAPVGGPLPSKTNTALIFTAGTSAFGAYSFPSSVGGWTGSEFFPLGIRTLNESGPAGNAVVHPIYGVAVGFQQTQFYKHNESTARTVINYPGSAPSFPIFRFDGPGTLWEVYNRTTGQVIYFNNLAIALGETVYLNLDPLNFRFYSNTRPDLSSYILPASIYDSFRLMKGNNNVGVLFSPTPTEAGDAGNNMANLTLEGIKRTNSVNGVVYLTLTKSGANYTLTVYADAAKNLLIATSTTVTAIQKEIVVAESNSSGVSGYYDLDVLPGATVNGITVAFPLVTVEYRVNHATMEAAIR